MLAEQWGALGGFGVGTCLGFVAGDRSGGQETLAHLLKGHHDGLKNEWAVGSP